MFYFLAKLIGKEDKFEKTRRKSSIISSDKIKAAKTSSKTWRSPRSSPKKQSKENNLSPTKQNDSKNLDAVKVKRSPRQLRSSPRNQSKSESFKKAQVETTEDKKTSSPTLLKQHSPRNSFLKKLESLELKNIEALSHSLKRKEEIVDSREIISKKLSENPKQANGETLKESFTSTKEHSLEKLEYVPRFEDIKFQKYEDKTSQRISSKFLLKQLLADKSSVSKKAKAKEEIDKVALEDKEVRKNEQISRNENEDSEIAKSFPRKQSPERLSNLFVGPKLEEKTELNKDTKDDSALEISKHSTKKTSPNEFSKYYEHSPRQMKDDSGIDNSKYSSQKYSPEKLSYISIENKNQEEKLVLSRRNSPGQKNYLNVLKSGEDKSSKNTPRKIQDDFELDNSQYFTQKYSPRKIDGEEALGNIVLNRDQIKNLNDLKNDESKVLQKSPRKNKDDSGIEISKYSTQKYSPKNQDWEEISSQIKHSDNIYNVIESDKDIIEEVERKSEESFLNQVYQQRIAKILLEKENKLTQYSSMASSIEYSRRQSVDKEVSPISSKDIQILPPNKEIELKIEDVKPDELITEIKEMDGSSIIRITPRQSMEEYNDFKSEMKDEDIKLELSDVEDINEEINYRKSSLSPVFEESSSRRTSTKSNATPPDLNLDALSDDMSDGSFCDPLNLKLIERISLISAKLGPCLSSEIQVQNEKKPEAQSMYEKVVESEPISNFVTASTSEIVLKPKRKMEMDTCSEFRFKGKTAEETECLLNSLSKQLNQLRSQSEKRMYFIF